MHRTLPNIIFLCILFLITTVLPLSTDILSLNLSQKIVDKPVEDIVLEPELTTVLPTTPDTIINSDIMFNIQSNMTLFPTDILSGFQLLVMKNDLSVAEYRLDELSPEIITVSEQERTIKINKQKLLETLPPAYYDVVLYEDSELLDYVWQSSSINYNKVLLATKNTLASKQLSMTLFIPTQDFKYSVPITRHVQTSENRFRTLYNTLLNGVKPELGLNELKPLFPASPNIRVSSKVANIYWYPANLIGFEEHLPVLSTAITKSFMSLGGVDGVKFVINNKTSGTDFGFDLAKTYVDSSINNAFIGYSHNSDYMMFLPMPLSSQDFDARVEEALKVLKFESAYNYSEDMIQTLPTEVDLLDHQLNGTELTLTLTENASNLFKNHPEHEKLMIQSLLYTFTSFPEVETVIIKVGTSPLITEIYDFSTGIKPDLYFNMEP